MMTYQDTAIAAEITLSGDTVQAEQDTRLPRPGSKFADRGITPRTDPYRRMSLVLVVEDGQDMARPMRELCDFLGVSVDRINSNEDLLPFLKRWQPMAVVAAMDATGQDGGNVLMTVARHDPSLPVLLMTDGDPALAGAVEAVTELWGLTEVMEASAWPSPGTLVEFLCRAGVRGNCLALMPV
jgi:CheY-like chemotaxis protein